MTTGPTDSSTGDSRPPRQEGRIALRALSLALSREQYVGARALLETLDEYAANTPYRAMRPQFRPASGIVAAGLGLWDCVNSCVYVAVVGFSMAKGTETVCEWVG